MSFHLKAQNTNFKELISLVGSEPTVEINLGPTMLSLLSSATNSENEGISKILSSLNSIKVTVFELEKNSKILPIRAQLDLIADNQTQKGFEKIASVKEDDSLVYIFADVQDKQFKSLNISALDDDDELVLITIDGNILVQDIGGLLNHFDVDLDFGALGSLKLDKNKD